MALIVALAILAYKRRDDKRRDDKKKPETLYAPNSSRAATGARDQRGSIFDAPAGREDSIMTGRADSMIEIAPTPSETTSRV